MALAYYFSTQYKPINSHKAAYKQRNSALLQAATIQNAASTETSSDARSLEAPTTASAALPAGGGGGGAVLKAENAAL